MSLQLTPKTIASLAAAAMLTCACHSSSSGDARRIEPVYDPASGKLLELKYDSKGTGKTDTWSYMDGAQFRRIEIDKDGDGKVDRWEYYDGKGKLEKVGLSRANDGKADAWAFQAADGSIARFEVSTRRDGIVNRTERFEKGALVGAEEDSDGDGKIDRWESYNGPALAMLQLDTLHRGKPDRRLIYPANGDVRVEADVKGDGQFVLLEGSR